MKCINLSPLCCRSKCECDESREQIVKLMTKLVERSRAYRMGITHDVNGDKIEDVADEDECARIMDWIVNELDPMKMELEYEIKKEVEEKQRYDLKKKLLKGNDIYRVGWTTISCPKDKDPPTMLRNTERLMKSKQYSDCTCVLEFTGAEKQYHPHLHLLFSEKQPKNKNLRDIGRIFGVNHKNPKFVDYKTLKSKDAIEEKKKYIQGDKQELKQSQIEGDKVVRQQYGIPEFFSQGNIYNG